MVAVADYNPLEILRWPLWSMKVISSWLEVWLLLPFITSWAQWFSTTSVLRWPLSFTSRMLWWPLTTITSWMLDQQSSPCVENTLPSYGSLPFTPDIVYGCWSPSSRGLERCLRSCSVSPVAEIGRIMAVNKSPVKVRLMYPSLFRG